METNAHELFGFYAFLKRYDCRFYGLFKPLCLLYESISLQLLAVLWDLCFVMFTVIIRKVEFTEGQIGTEKYVLVQLTTSRKI